MEFPAVSHTRVEFWQERHYTRNGMWWFTLFFGFFGLHHLMLKSPQTAVLVVLGNIFFLGLPWLYDLVQLSSWGLDDRELNTYGLDHPFGTMGLAKGMWKPTDNFVDTSPYKDNTSSKIPLSYLFYSAFVWCSPIASLAAGDSKSFFIRIVQFILISVYEVICIIFDIITLIFMPGTLIFGIKRPWLFANRFMDHIWPGLSFSNDGYSPNIMPVYFANNLDSYSEKLQKYNMYKTMQEESAKASQQGGGGDVAPPIQEGGGKTLFDYFSLTTVVAIIAGGLLLSAGRKANGLFPDKNDTPPKPRDV
jgi:TM2 domain-containing membrane protein YozV